jgi:hypothetical protein
VGLFSKKGDKQSEFGRFASMFSKIWKRKANKRKDAVGILPPDMLAKREKLTRHGKQNLVLQYGRKGGTVEYTLDELNKMAVALEQKQGQFKEAERGVEVGALLRASRVPVDIDGIRRGATDISKAKGIRNATLFQLRNHVLFFRVTSSGQNPRHTHYEVRIRLEDWQREMVRRTGAYIVPAQKACRGRVSFDCACGRHQYWFRYLATIGGFALDPLEHGFPKIRNPRLLGCACKHVIKAVAVMQTPFVHAQVAKAMAAEAKDKGWFGKLAERVGLDKGKALSETDLEGAEKAGDAQVDQKLWEEFNQFSKNKKVFARQQRDEEMKRQTLLAKLEAAMLRDVYKLKKPREEAIERFAVKNNMQIGTVEDMAKGLDI